MIRDPGPLHNIGFSVTSRDVPLNEGEAEGDAPNSGYVARALNGHPIMRFLAASAATMVGTAVASKLTKSGGLKLASYIQKDADKALDAGQSTFSTRLIKNVVDIRKQLDELQGITRFVEGEDPYSKLVFKQDNKLTTGYDGALSERRWFEFSTSEEKQDAAKGFLGEPTAVWAYRDELQQRLVRAGRKLPYELPAMYGVQKAVIDPLFAERENQERKVKWYNPVDVVADFTKSSLINIATMVLPFEALGAGASQARSSLNTLRYSMGDLQRLSPSFQKKAYRTVADVSDLLGEVGQDLATAGNKFLKKTSQLSGGFSSAAEAYGSQPEFVQNLSALKHGVRAARQAAVDQDSSRAKLTKVTFASLFKGGQDFKPVYELSPSLRGMPAAAKAGLSEYRLLGRAYDAMDSAIARDRLLKDKISPIKSDALDSAIRRIESMHSSRLSSFAGGVRTLGGGGSKTSAFRNSEFFLGSRDTAFKDLIKEQLISNGVAPEAASIFTKNASITPPRLNTDPTQILTIGKHKIRPVGNTPQEINDDFFSQVTKRFRGIKNGKTFVEAMNGNKDALEQSLLQAKSIFTSQDFQKTLNARIANDWDTISNRDLNTLGKNILKSKKAQYTDFIEPDATKVDFLRRKTAQTLGVNLDNVDGLPVTDDYIFRELAKRGIDPHDHIAQRAFLIKHRKMSTGIIGGGYNFLGLQPLGVTEALEKGRFNHLRKEEQQVIASLAGKRTLEDTASSAFTLSALDGVYKTRSGTILDFTSIKSTFSRGANFFASEFKIPVLGFNPVDLFGYQSFNAMANKSPLQYVSARSVQPFVKTAEGAAQPEYYLWAKAKGSKGRVVSFSRESGTDQIRSETLSGLYRALPTQSSDLITRHTRFGSGNAGETPDEIRGGKSPGWLAKILGNNEELAFKIKRKLNIDQDQPNSIAGALRRFARRNTDTNNPRVMGNILRGNNLNGKPIDFDDMTPGFLDGVDTLRAAAAKTGFTPHVMEQLEAQHPALFTMFGKGASSIKTTQDALDFFENIEASISTLSKKLKDQGVDSTQLRTSASRMRNMAGESNLNAISQMAQYSPTLTQKLDVFRNEIFSYIAQANQVLTSKDSNDIFIKIVQSVDKLKGSGKISAAERTEAQAAGLSMMFNFSAFKTFSEAADVGTNAKNQVAELIRMSKGAESLFDPYTQGTISRLKSSGRNRFSFLSSPATKYLGYAEFSPDEMGIDPLGSGQGVTLLPTFGTVFARNPYGAIASALGLNTYKSPDSFSSASVPMSQAVERLNRYFGTVGLQLNVNDFSGPLDLFARGMIGKRAVPLYVAGTAALTVDRTAGGLVNDKDDRGERVYSPLVVGALARGGVEAQAIISGIVPGGPSFEEKREQLLEGEVAVRQGRFWPLGNQPFRGGKVMYYRPSYYRRLQEAPTYTSDSFGSPIEKFLFYNDTSPLRPFDPYRFERKHYEDRPYPLTGEYFSGPFGPIVPLANATIGRVLKPQIQMHGEEVAAGLSAFTRAGASGAYDTTGYATPGGMAIGGGGSGGGGYRDGGGVLGAVNAELASRAGSMNTAQGMTRQSIRDMNSELVSMSFGPPKQRGVMNPRIVSSGTPLVTGSSQFQAGEFGYRTQEMLGIYGFASASIRESLGFGQGDFEPQRSVLQSASKGYGTSRAFWDLNLGGLGDVPLPSQDALGNIEFSEIVRRFIPKDRTNVDYVNPIQNLMGQQYPWLPGAEYFTDFTRGDPFVKVQEGEMRLPGVAYERFNKLYPDQTGQYGLVNQLDILGDVAPWSQQFKKLNASIDTQNLSIDQKLKVQQVRDQVSKTTKRHEFSEYSYRGTEAEGSGMRDSMHLAARAGEAITHSDNFVLSKIFGKKTALEDWERNNVYGATFPEWQRPYESYIQPMINTATQRNPLSAAASLGFVGGMFGRTARARLFGSSIGIATGAGASAYGKVSEFVTGERFIPEVRKEELALEEYTDILSYVKNTRLSSQARQAGDGAAAAQFSQAAGRTMYGMDLSQLRSPDRSKNLDMISLAIPKRKREHFQAMLSAPEQDRKKILSTAGRLERRMYQAAWGMDVEQRPELEDYFSKRELPDENWEGWLPNTNMDHVKIKTGQSMGLHLSQMGYYPQQIKEANLTNPSYPEFGIKSDRSDVTNRLRALMSGMGINGSVTPVMNPFGSQRLDVYAGAR